MGTTMAEDDAGSGGRQRRLYDELWRAARTRALSADLVRFRVWVPHLRPPVVDVGAGDALLMRSFPTTDVISLDLSDVGLRQAGRLSCVAAAENLPLRDGSVRTVVLSEVLEHVTDPDRVLAQCRRAVAPEGRVLLSAPLWPIAPVALAVFWRRIRRRPALENMALWDPEHERRFARDELVARTEAAGFVVDEEVPLFGSASSTALYVVEPLLERLLRRRVRLAHLVTGLDRLIRRMDRASATALVCRPDRGPTPPAAPTGASSWPRPCSSEPRHRRR